MPDVLFRAERVLMRVDLLLYLFRHSQQRIVVLGIAAVEIGKALCLPDGVVGHRRSPPFLFWENAGFPKTSVAAAGKKTRGKS